MRPRRGVTEICAHCGRPSLGRLCSYHAQIERERTQRTTERCNHCLADVPAPAFARGPEHLPGCIRRKP